MAARPTMAVVSSGDVDDPSPELGPPAGAKAGAVANLLRGAAGSLGLNLVNSGLTFLATVIVARVLSVEDFGVFAFVVALGLLLAVPAVLGFDRLVIREVAAYLARSAWPLMRGLVISANVIVFVNAAMLALAAGTIAALTTADDVLRSAVLVGLLAIPAMAVGRVGQGVLMGLHRVVSAQAPDLALRPALFLGFVAVVVLLLPGGLDSRVAVGLHVASVVVATGATLVLMRRWWPREASVSAAQYETRTWGRSALALTLLNGVMVINAQSGTVMLGLLRSTDEAGLFSVASRGAMLIAFGLGAVNAALQPTVSRLWTMGRMEELQHLVTVSARAVLVFSLPVTLVFVVFATEILTVAFGAGYATAGPAFAVLSAAQLVNAAIGSVGALLIMTGHQRDAALGIAVGAGLNIVLGLVLIPMAGALGAALAAAISIATWNILLALAAVRRLGIHSTALGRLPARLSSLRHS